MKRSIYLSVLACSGLASTASAQTFQGQLGQYAPPPGMSRPIVSPYLNMARPGSNAAINYYGLVRPQMDVSRNLSQLQQQFQQMDTTSSLATGTTTSMPMATSMLTTGHPVAFMNYGSYFPLFNRGGGGAGVPARANTGGLGGLGMGGSPFMGPFGNSGIGVGLLVR